MKKTSLTILALALVCAGGCTTANYERTETGGETVKFRIVSFATKKSIGDLSLAVSTNYTRTFRLKGYGNDQVDAIGVAVDAAVKAAIASGKP